MAVQKLDIEKVISERENRPALWDMRKKEYSDRVVKRKCWEEIVDLFANENMSIEEKKTLGNELHEKWKNIRDNFSRDIQQRKGKSGDGRRQKAPYVYTQRLQFLIDTIVPKKTTNSLEPTETNDDESSLQFDNRPDISRPNSTNKISSTVGKKRLHHVEDKILRSLENYEKRANKPVIEDDNKYFALSLVSTLASLPRHLNMKCRLEIMQTIAKYATMAEQNQTASQPPRQPSSMIHYPIKSTFVPNSQQYETSHNQTMMTNEQPISIVSSAPSPVESAVSYFSNFSEDDSQFSIF